MKETMSGGECRGEEKKKGDSKLRNPSLTQRVKEVEEETRHIQISSNSEDACITRGRV